MAMELQLQELDYWAIGVYILLMAGIGLSFGWFIKDVGAYFKGNGTIPWVMATAVSYTHLPMFLICWHMFHGLIEVNLQFRTSLGLLWGWKLLLQECLGPDV